MMIGTDRSNGNSMFKAISARIIYMTNKVGRLLFRK